MRIVKGFHLSFYAFTRNATMLLFLLFACIETDGQITLYSENFGTVSSFPAGWTQTGTSQQWFVNSTNPSTTPTFSGGSNLYAQNQNTNGVTHTVTYANNLSTIGYTNVKVIWAARATSTFSQPITFSWSPDGTTWNPVTYTQVASNATWANVNNNVKIALPASAENLSNLRFKWSYNANNNGNYRIDDFIVEASAGCPVQISSFTPASGPAGTEVTISGSGFLGATIVSFNGIASTSFSVVNDNTITATVPVGASTGSISVFNACSGLSATVFTVIKTSCAYSGTNLILSELCVPKNNFGTDRFIEIFNPTNVPINLSGWTVRAISNGDINVDCIQWNLSGTIQAGQALTCGFNSPVFGGPHTFTNTDWWASYPTNTNSNICNYNWNGQQRDGATLYQGTTRIDGILRANSGIAWYDDKSLIRNSDICSPNPNSAVTEWTASTEVLHAGEAPSSPRSHTANCTVQQPTVTLHPISQSFCSGQTITLSVAGSGGISPYNYIWKVYTGTGTWQTVTNTAPYSGANTATLTIANVPLAFNKYQYYCEIWNQDNSCYQASNAAMITVASNLVPEILIAADNNPVCSGVPVVFTATTVNGGNTPIYQWKKNNSNVGSNSSTYTDNALLNSDEIKCILTSSSSCASPSFVTSNTVIMGVTGSLTPTISISADNNPVCEGATVVFTSSIQNGGPTPFYQWKKNGLPVGTNSPSYTDNSLNNNDDITCVLTSNSTCVSSNPIATSNEVIMIVTTNQAPSILISADNNPICTGTTVVFIANPNYGGNTPVFQWKKNNLDVGTNSPIYSDNTLANNDVISCVLSSTANCVSSYTATSNSITMVVTANLAPLISISADNNPICAGTTVVFTSTCNNEGSTPDYHWKKNGIDVGSNSFTYTDNTLVNNDIITCLLTSSSTCASPPTANSNSIIMTVTPSAEPEITISANHNSICAGTTVTFSSTINNGGSGPIYEWKKNNLFVGTNSPTYTDNVLSNNDLISCTLTSNSSCASTPIDTSNIITMIVSAIPITPPIKSFNVVAGTQDVCEGSLYTYAIDPPTAGSTYNWNLSGGGNITSGNSNQNNITWTNTGNYTLTVTETSASGCTGVPVILSITVDSISTPKVTISTPNNTVCEGTQVTFYASPVNGGTNPTYKWFVNGIQQPNTGLSTLTFKPNDGEKVYAVLTSSIPCASPVSVTSVIDTMFVNKLEQPTIDLLTPASSLCSGDTAKIIADLKFEGSSPQYTWYRNGSVIPGENTDSLKFIPNNGDKITAKLTSNYDCVNSNNPISAPLTFTVSNNAPVSLGISQQTTLCNTDLITIQANPTNGGPAPVYEWFLNGILVSGQTTAAFKGMFADGDKIYAKVTSSLTCADPTSNPATSGPPITIFRPPLLQITKVDSTNESCSLKNASITITALGGTPPYKYSINTPVDWFDSPLFDSLSAALPFTIQTKDNNGCIAYRGICQLNNTPGATIATSGSGVYCEGDSVKLKVTSPAVLSYQWTFPSGYISTLDSIIIASVSINDTGSYKITATQLSTGCQDQTELHIQVNKQPVVDFGLPATLCAGSQQDLTPGPGFASYVWQDGSTNPVYSAVNAGVYYVIATYASGCKGVDSLELINCAEIYLPTAFSPNMNGSNECFHPITGGIVLLDYKMVIYNRWGQLVFESNDYLFGWNGKNQGSEAPAGLYNYFITYKVSDPISVGSEKLIKRRGTVMVVR